MLVVNTEIKDPTAAYKLVASLSDERPARRRMDFKSRLQRQYLTIVQDLDVKYILDELYQQNVLSNSDLNEILAVTGRAKQTRFLLELLMQNGTVASYEAFVDILAKDYGWLHEKLIENHVAVIDDSFEDCLSKGDVPRLPDHHARRSAVESDVASKLRQLKRHEILALHGMSGSGKTCVAISTLRDNADLITSSFNGVVLWLNLGDCKTGNDIIAHQDKLLRKLSSTYNNKKSLINSSTSISSNGSTCDTLISYLDMDWQDLRNKLKLKFLEESLKECLLVLDEVNDRKCFEAFDIGCKILITTRDTEVLENCNGQTVTIENSLQEQESLQIFASYLDETVPKLPRQAKTLHELCKGNPFYIKLIGAHLAENKEKLKHDPNHWNYYVEKLKKKEFSIFSTRPKQEAMEPIEVCITALDDNILKLFKMLAILPDNVKVSNEMLSKLWERGTDEVTPIVRSLKSKSLIIETYDREQRCYLYEVHDIIMNYLKTCLKDDEKRKTHERLLNNYNYTRNNTPAEILDDGYIAFYIGYHILNTNNLNGKWDLFKKLFLDLKFLGSKVRLTGSADVILDFHKYENYIAGNELDKNLFANIKSYLSTHGTDLYRYQSTDIIQSILQHESQGVLFNRASEIAQINCEKNELYFEFLHEQDSDGIKHSTIDVNDKISCISVLGNDLLVGTSDGVVKFFDIPTNKLKKELSEHETSPDVPVKWIGVAYSKNPPMIAVLYSNGVLKLWYIDGIVRDNEDGVIEEEPEENYNNNDPGTKIIRSTVSPIIKCRWSINEDYLIAQTADMIILYRPNGDIANIINNFEGNVQLVCSVPCSNDRYVAVATTGSRKGVDIIDLMTNEKYISYEESTNESESVLDILVVPGTMKIITLKRAKVTQHEFKINRDRLKRHTCETKAIFTSASVKDTLYFLSMAVNKTGTLLFVSTNDSRVICINLKNNLYLFDLDNKRGNVVTMAVSEILMDEFVPGLDVLFTGTEAIEKSAKVWYLDATYISHATHKNGKVRLTTKFDVSFLHSPSPISPVHSGKESTNHTRKRHQSFANHNEAKTHSIVSKMSSFSLDRRGLKPLNLKGICNNNEVSTHPLLAVIDDNNNIQVMRGRKMLTEITEVSNDNITDVKITPCNQHIIYGLQSGYVKRYTLRTKETTTIMDLCSPVHYMKFVHNNLLMVAGGMRIMTYRLMTDGTWETEMLQSGNTFLGSQELLNDINAPRSNTAEKTSLSDRISHSSSDLNHEFPERLFGNNAKELNKSSELVDCFFVPEDNLITVENNATIKLWDNNLKLSCILNARQSDANVRCAAFKKNILVICDVMTFQTFELNEVSQRLNQIQEMRLKNDITSCDLTADGNILAMGLISGHVVIWNVNAKRQINVLRHHTSDVQSCSFSAVPSRLYRSSSQSFGTPNITMEEQPPLVLVTMAAEIVWWDISYAMKAGATANRAGRTNVNAMTPLASPHESRMEILLDETNANANVSGSPTNFFFAEGRLNEHCWNNIWKSKTYKEGSKRKEILSCIKLTGMTSERLCHDEKFSCFVTVDNPGHIHIMNVMRKAT